MGKGDARTKRGKIFRHSFGNTRPANPHRNKGEGTSSTARAARSSSAPAPRGRGKR